MSDRLPDRDTLKQLLDYDPETGKLYWKARPREMFTSQAVCDAWNRRYAGGEALAAKNARGYLHGGLLGKDVFTHRVIWKLVFGTCAEDIDHENGRRDDNRLVNLRSVSHRENSKNRALRFDNPAGHHGVRSKNGRWSARIEDRYLGTFDTKEAAIIARKTAEVTLGYHANHGRSA